MWRHGSGQRGGHAVAAQVGAAGRPCSDMGRASGQAMRQQHELGQQGGHVVAQVGSTGRPAMVSPNLCLKLN